MVYIKYKFTGFSIITSKKIYRKSKLCYIIADSFLTYVKTDYFYEGVKYDVEKRFDTSNHYVKGPLLIEKKEKNCWYNENNDLVLDQTCILI